MQLWTRIGLLATLWSYVSNQLLVDDLGPHDALADMIVVAPQARGRGIGVALMRWCEAAASAEFPSELHVNLFLWVGAYLLHRCCPSNRCQVARLYIWKLPGVTQGFLACARPTPSFLVHVCFPRLDGHSLAMVCRACVMGSAARPRHLLERLVQRQQL